MVLGVKIMTIVWYCHVAVMQLLRYCYGEATECNYAYSIYMNLITKLTAII